LIGFSTAFAVMAGLVPAIHVGTSSCARQYGLVGHDVPSLALYDVDGRDKPGHDGERAGRSLRACIPLTFALVSFPGCK